MPSMTKIVFMIMVFPMLLSAFLLHPRQTNAETTVPADFYFERTLRVGAEGEDVRYLQQLLNQDSETSVRAPGLRGGLGNETTFFGPATEKAVIAFQKKYAMEVLAPARLTKGTGTVGPLTRIKLNTLLAFARANVSRQEEELVESAVLQTSTEPAFSFEELNTKTRGALVNILCTSKSGGVFSPLSGSGITIDPRGVVLTNAHIGQYFLLKDYLAPGYIDCVIRTGEPAQNRYRATLLYISSEWVARNAEKISEERPTGTGEYDFALLLIDRSASPDSPLPSAFPFIPMNDTGASVNLRELALAAAYPAGFLSGINIQRDLYPSSSVVTVGRVYSFHGKGADIFSIGGSVIAQQGSSGGAVVNQYGKLIGLIVTSSAGKTTSERNLNALSVRHIENTLQKETGYDLPSFFSGDITAQAKNFNLEKVPDLRKKLLTALAPD